MNDEIWLSIQEYSNYEISSQGRVRRRLTGQILIPWKANGYLYVGLRNERGRKNKSIHRLVAEAFLGVHPELEVNHIDGDKENNSVENLEWCTSSYNIRHAMALGLYTPYKLPPHPHEKKAVRIVETGDEFDSLTECAEAIGGFKTAISACLLGKVKTHLGYHFEEVK